MAMDLFNMTVQRIASPTLMKWQLLAVLSVPLRVTANRARARAGRCRLVSDMVMMRRLAATQCDLLVSAEWHRLCVLSGSGVRGCSRLR